MIVYQATKAEFADDVLTDQIEHRILEFFRKNLKRSTSRSEIESWKNSMLYMHKVLNDPSIPDDCGVAIEYQLPQSGKRLDFVLTGLGSDEKEYAIMIELKQWSAASRTGKDGIVETIINKGPKETPHPSYQVWSYAVLLKNFNETVEKDQIILQPCAYLHNYIADEVIRHEQYREYIEKAPVFLRGEAVKLREFIKQYVNRGDQTKILYRIENGRIRPSKMLADSMASMLKNNPEFIMIDDQKIVFEMGLALSRRAGDDKKKVLIVKGGPGTGKSVVAINLLVSLGKIGLNAQYVSKNAAPRAVYESKLTGTIRKTEIGNMFRGSGGFVEASLNQFDTLIIDEAHRLNERSGLYNNLGENQIKELINAARCTIFFLDEDQRIHLNDIGSVREIKKWASRAGADVYETDLSSQFRCNGSDGYLAWLDHTLQIRDTANTTLDTAQYDFRIFDSPNQLREAIMEKNLVNNKSRMVAGYCWKWNSKKNKDLYDVVIPEHDFQMRWNLNEDGSLWIIKPDSVNEIGCIHTCQGLEVDYVGVIVGPDLIVRDGQVLTEASARAKDDYSVRGYKKLMQKNPTETKETLHAIIKNTYRTLMTRGMKGCWVYFTDEETRKYFHNAVDTNSNF